MTVQAMHAQEAVRVSIHTTKLTFHQLLLQTLIPISTLFNIWLVSVKLNNVSLTDYLLFSFSQCKFSFKMFNLLNCIYTHNMNIPPHFNEKTIHSLRYLHLQDFLSLVAFSIYIRFESVLDFQMEIVTLIINADLVCEGMQVEKRGEPKWHKLTPEKKNSQGKVPKSGEHVHGQNPLQVSK